MDFIKAGYGCNFGQNFKRVTANTVIEITERSGSEVFGYIDIPEYGRVKVRTTWQAILFGVE